MGRRALLVVVALCAGVAACGVLTDFGDLSGGAGPIDASGLDGPSGADGADAPGASTDGDAGPASGGPCDATFCDDFERDTLQGPWSELQVARDGELAIVAGNAGTGRVLAANRLAGSASNTPEAYLFNDLGPGSRVRYALDLYIVGTVPNYAIVFSVEVDQGGGKHGAVALQRGGTGSSLAPASVYRWPDGGSGYAIGSFSTPFATGVWQRVELTLQLAASPPSHYTVKLNGLTVVDNQATLGDLATPATVGVQAGLSSTDAVNDNFRVLIDNVVVDVTP